MSKKSNENPKKSTVSFEKLLKRSSQNIISVLPDVVSDTDSDDETIMKKTNPLPTSSKRWFQGVYNKKAPNNKLYKISEESEGSSQHQ